MREIQFRRGITLRINDEHLAVVQRTRSQLAKLGDHRVSAQILPSIQPATGA